MSLLVHFFVIKKFFKKVIDFTLQNVCNVLIKLVVIRSND